MLSTVWAAQLTAGSVLLGLLPWWARVAAGTLEGWAARPAAAAWDQLWVGLSLCFLLQLVAMFLFWQSCVPVRGVQGATLLVVLILAAAAEAAAAARQRRPAESGAGPVAAGPVGSDGPEAEAEAEAGRPAEFWAFVVLGAGLLALAAAVGPSAPPAAAAVLRPGGESSRPTAATPVENPYCSCKLTRWC